MEIIKIFELLADLQTVLKIFVFMSIYSFARNHIGGGPITMGVIIILSFLVLFVFWPLFGTLYLLYMLGMMGLCGVLIDFFFVTAGGPPEGAPVSSGADLMKRMVMMKHRRPKR